MSNYRSVSNVELMHGALPGFERRGGGGGKNFFSDFRFGNLHVAKEHAAHGEAMRSARGVRGHAPPRKSDFLFFFSEITIFYIKNIYFRYTLVMGYFS